MPQTWKEFKEEFERSGAKDTDLVEGWVCVLTPEQIKVRDEFFGNERMFINYTKEVAANLQAAAEAFKNRKKD